MTTGHTSRSISCSTVPGDAAHLHPRLLLPPRPHLHPSAPDGTSLETPVQHRPHLVLPRRHVQNEVGVHPTGCRCGRRVGDRRGQGRGQAGRKGGRMDALVGLCVSCGMERVISREGAKRLIVFNLNACCDRMCVSFTV